MLVTCEECYFDAFDFIEDIKILNLNEYKSL